MRITNLKQVSPNYPVIIVIENPPFDCKIKNLEIIETRFVSHWASKSGFALAVFSGKTKTGIKIQTNIQVDREGNFLNSRKERGNRDNTNFHIFPNKESYMDWITNHFSDLIEEAYYVQ